MIRALIFDFDGLILDTESPDIQSWRETYADFGHPFPEEDWLPVIGRSSADLVFNPYEHPRVTHRSPYRSRSYPCETPPAQPGPNRGPAHFTRGRDVYSRRPTTGVETRCRIELNP